MYYSKPALLALFLGAACPLFTCASASQAQTVDHSNIITNADVATLSSYLGEGPLTLTNIFSHVNGDSQTSTDFHTAADGKGRTFSVANVTSYNNGIPLTALIGGYDPLSWNSTSGYNTSPTNAERTGFLFNLTQNLFQKQNLIGQGYSGSGYYQTIDDTASGPTFGENADLVIDNTLNHASFLNFDYGGTSFGTNILGSPGGSYYTGGLTLSNVEVFTIGTTAVPELSTMLGFGSFVALGGLAAFRQRKRMLKTA